MVSKSLVFNPGMESGTGRARGTPVTDSGQTGEHEPRRILVVDDDPAVREMLVRVLTGEGYSTCEAANGDEALRISAAVRPDLVLLDLGLPGQSGWDILANLTRPKPGLAVVIITAWPNQAPAAQAAGASALLEKPLDFPMLLQTIAGFLARPPEQWLAPTAGRTASPS